NRSYNSHHTKLVRRFGKSLFMTADYVWSKALDLEDTDNGNINATNGSGNPLTDPFNPKRDSARAGFDRKHAFNLNTIYTVPNFLHGEGSIKYLTNGWQVGALWKKWSGAPLDVFLANGP